MVRRTLVLVGLLAGTTSASQAGQTSVLGRQSPRFSASDVFALRWAEDVQISPDARFVAYVRVENDIRTDAGRRSVWLADLADGHEHLLSPDASSPRWAPGGSQVAFVAQSSAGAELRIVTADGTGGRVVARLPAAPSAPVWAPDGRSIAFTRFVEDTADSYVPPVSKPQGATWQPPPRVFTRFVYQHDGERFPTPGSTRLFVVPTQGGVPRQLTFGQTNNVGDPAWTGDGRTLLFAGSQGEVLGSTYFSNRVFRVAAAGGDPVAISPPGLAADDPAVSPDGRRLAFVGRRPNGHDYVQGGIYVGTVDGGQVRPVFAGLDRELERPRWTEDGSALFVTYGDGGHQVLARGALDGEPAVLLPDMGDDGAYSLARDSVAFATAPFASPGDATVLPASGVPHRLTRLNETLLAGKALATVQPIGFTSPEDHAEVGAWLVLPPGGAGGGRLPTILSIHGGPHGFDDPGWNTEDQLFAASGYAVLHVNYRGSTSYGFAFADRTARDFPGPAYGDLMGGVDAAVRAGFADPDRLFLMGGSAGGELTAWLVGRTHRFRAAAAIKPVINVASEALTTESYAYALSAYGAYPWDDPLLYWRRSPLSAVGHVTTPTMVMVGERDHNTSPGEAEQFYSALRLLNVPSALVVIPDAGNASIAGTPSRLIAETSIVLDWFEKHGGAPSRDERSPAIERLLPR